MTSVLLLLAALARPAAALPGCGALDQDLEGRRVDARSAALRALESSGDQPGTADPTELSPGFPSGFQVCWADPRLRAFDPRALAALARPDAYAPRDGSWADGAVLDPLLQSAGAVRHGARFYLLINPSLDPRSAREAVAEQAAVIEACRAEVKAGDRSWALLRVAAGRCQERALGTEGAAPPPPSLRAERRAALRQLRARIDQGKDAPEPGLWESYCYDAAARAYVHVVPEESWSDEEIADRCVLFGNDGFAVQIDLDGPHEWRDWLSLLREQRDRSAKAFEKKDLPLAAPGGFGGAE